MPSVRTPSSRDVESSPESSAWYGVEERHLQRSYGTAVATSQGFLGHGIGGAVPHDQATGKHASALDIASD